MKFPDIAMSNRRRKLELAWIGKENRPKLEPRNLVEDPTRSYHAKHRVTSADFFDNLLALKALEAACSGKVKCARRLPGNRRVSPSILSLLPQGID